MRERCLPFEVVALVLQGGSSLGAYQAGVYEALAEGRIYPDWVAGMSIGAVNVAIIFLRAWAAGGNLVLWSDCLLLATTEFAKAAIKDQAPQAISWFGGLAIRRQLMINQSTSPTIADAASIVRIVQAGANYFGRLGSLFAAVPQSLCGTQMEKAQMHFALTSVRNGRSRKPRRFGSALPLFVNLVCTKRPSRPHLGQTWIKPIDLSLRHWPGRAHPTKRNLSVLAAAVLVAALSATDAPAAGQSAEPEHSNIDSAFGAGAGGMPLPNSVRRSPPTFNHSPHAVPASPESPVMPCSLVIMRGLPCH
jgi:Patatin-like phospholipase